MKSQLLGLEIYAAVMKVKACQNVRDNAHKSVKNMRKADSDINVMLVDVKEYQRRVTVEVSFVVVIYFI